MSQANQFLNMLKFYSVLHIFILYFRYSVKRLVDKMKLISRTITDLYV